MPFGPLSRSKALPVRVQPFFGYRNADRVFLNARAIRSPEPIFETRSFWRDFATMVGQYMSKEVPGLPVELVYDLGKGRVIQHTVVTGPEGYARFDIAFDQPAPRPDRTRWEKASVRWRGDDGKSLEASAYILTPGSQTQTGVISDIDDTILETGITGSLRMIARNWKRVMATMPSQRALVPGAPDFYAAIGGKGVAAGGSGDAAEPQARVRPVFYVSSSPWNLFSYLVTYIRGRGLPLGPIFLRDWGFNRDTFGSASHGAHKRAAIDGIVETYPEMKFALIGDDSQGDLIAFSEIALDHPHRIRAIFIRKVGDAMSAEEITAKAKLEVAEVPLWLGDSYQTGHEFLASIGLLADSEARAIIDTVEATTPEIASRWP